MFEKYSEKARRVIFYARYEASQFGSPYIETEHLLLGIVREDRALMLRLLQSPEKVDTLKTQIETQCPQGERTSTSVDLPLNEECRHVLEHAAKEAEQLHHEHIVPQHLLLGIAIEEASLGAKILRESGLTVSALRADAALSTTVGYTRPPAEPPETHPFGEAAGQPDVLRNLSTAARDGTLGPLIGRERELDRVIQILSRRFRNNPLLVGESGVGKTAIVEGLAQRIADGDVPAALADRPFFVIDASSLVAPSRRARSGERPEPLLAQIISRPIGILCLDGLLDLAASPGWGAVEATHVLEVLTRAGIQCIATGTPAGLHHAVERTAALVRHFEVVEVAPPTADEAIEILNGTKEKYEKFHDVVFTEGVMQAAVNASGRFLTHRYLPDRALDLIDEAGARVKVRQETNPPEEAEIRKRIRHVVRNMENAIANHQFDKAREYSDQERIERQKLHALRNQREASGSLANVVTPSDIEETVAERAGVPVSAVREVLEQKRGKELQLVMEELARGISVERSAWLPLLAAYLIGCSAGDAERLAQSIREAKDKLSK